VCDIVRKALRKKYVEGDVSIRDSFKKKMSQRDWSHIDPMVPQQG